MNPREKKPRSVKRVKPELPGGFRDYAPQEAMLKQRLLERARKTFESFGFEPMETPSVERTEVLLGGEEESDKIIFNVNSSTRSEYKSKDKLSLRFDLTVPLARFVAANPGIPKPFKRYQIGQVFRGESPQAGRYREFTQADIDIVGVSSVDADTEIIGVMAAFFKNIGLRSFLIKINNREILNALPQYAGFSEKKLWPLLRILDKKDKIGKEGVRREVTKAFGKKVADKIDLFMVISGDTRIKLRGAGKLLNGIMTAEVGIIQLIEIERGLDAMGVNRANWEIDFSMVRGLGYYTGPIFEAVLLKAPELGTMFAGGRYDNLLSAFTGEKLPAVGASLGVDRLVAALEALGLIPKKPTAIKVLVLNLSSSLNPEYLTFATTLRQANVNTAVYLGNDRTFQAQLAYAVKKEIPYVLIYGEEERKKGVVTVKNLVKREQKEIPKENLVEYFKK